MTIERLEQLANATGEFMHPVARERRDLAAELLKYKKTEAVEQATLEAKLKIIEDSERQLLALIGCGMGNLDSEGTN